MHIEQEPQPRSISSHRARKALAVAAGISLAMSGCSKPSKSDLDGECHPFTVYAQNVWLPIGAAKYKIPKPPDPTKKPDPNIVGRYAGNEIISVNGWFHSGTPVYPNNPDPYNSDIWFRVVNGKWVNFAAVRGEKTEFDSTGHGDGGPAAPTPHECEIKDPPVIPSELISPSGPTTAR